MTRNRRAVERTTGRRRRSKGSGGEGETGGETIRTGVNNRGATGSAGWRRGEAARREGGKEVRKVGKLNNKIKND